jgi:hypothetical protein
MKKRISFVSVLLLIVILFGFMACETTGTASSGATPVYAATIWVNGEAQTLGENGNASSVHVKDGNVFVAGMSVSENGIVMATLWVNGVPQTLSENTSQALSVFVSGDDVYAAGYENGVATLWVNGTPQRLSNNDSFANSVFVSGNNVYVAGNVGIQFGISYGNPRATLWTNGVPRTLSNDTSQARSVFVSGNDIYVAGSTATNDVLNRRNEQGSIIRLNRATLWVNGASQRLGGTTINNNQMARGERESHTFADSVFVSDNGVFVAGTDDRERERPGHQGLTTYYHGSRRFWVNQELQTLRGIGSVLSEGQSRANSVFVSDGNVFVAGNTEHVPLVGNAIMRAILWTNGTPETLSTVESRANSVFVYGNDIYVAGAIRQN